MALSALPDFTRRMSLTSPIFSLPAFVWADATPVMRATLKSVAATYLETMRFLPCFKAKLLAQMRGYIDCGQFLPTLVVLTFHKLTLRRRDNYCGQDC